jgi:transformation/transcription domain-associated protein
LSTCLLIGLSQLLSLLSSWFNKTLGEKLLDHLQKWTDPKRIKSHKIWKEGEEPDVAASIVGLFTLLPHASNFVDPLVKTTIKLEACLPAYKSRHIYSPYRKPLALYLNKYSQYTVAFFLQRLKTPLYTELFQDIVGFEDSIQLRQYLSGRKCSVSVLNVSFERPLAIIRSEKSSVTGASPTKALKSDTSLPLYGIHPFPSRPQNQREAMLLRDQSTKEKKLRILQQEFLKAKEHCQVRGAAGSGKTANPEAKAAYEESKKKLKVAKAAFDRGVREVADIKKRYAAEVEKTKAPQESAPKPPDGIRPMTIDSLELQFQGFRLIETLVKYDSGYLKQDNDVLRALRWLWK